MPARSYWVCVAISVARLSYGRVGQRCSCLLEARIVLPHLIEPLSDRLHDLVEVSRQQGQAARVEQEPALAARLRARGTRCIAMRELLVLSEGRDVLRREAEAVVRHRGRCRGRLWGSLLSCSFPVVLR